MTVVTIERKILKKNDEIAGEVRSLLKENGVYAINLLSSPGSGKTSLLENTLAKLKESLNVIVVEGDPQTSNDAERVAKHAVPVTQIVTNGGCHLEAKLVQDALPSFDLSGTDLLIIENVGNLVCPANYDLGEDIKVVMVSTTEGDDKPLKYPAMFRVADVMLINKIDLLEYVDFDVEAVKRNALQINPNLTVFEISCRSGAGLDNWTDWLAGKVKAGTASGN
jgi:hydrogenase nickel incorporation protein HypB